MPDDALIAAADALPEDATAPAKTDLAPDQVFERLKAGKVVEHARVRRLKFRGTFDHPVRFRHCTLVQCEFDGVTFREDVSFANCGLDRVTFHRPCTFEKGFEAVHSCLNKPTIRNATFRGEAVFAYTELRGKIAFADCTFEKRASFWEACFGTWADFKACEFKGEADFRTVTAQQGFVLTKCAFRGDFLFRGSTVEKKFQADGSRFEGLLDLSKAKLRDFAYLEAIDQGPSQTFAFLNAIAELVRVRPAQVEGRLASETAGRHEDAMQEYGLLKTCYQALHRYDCEDWAFYRFKVNQRRAKKYTWRKPWVAWRAAAEWLFLDVGCGYGTNPARAVRMAAVIILGFALVYALNVEMFYTEKLPFPERQRDGVLNSSMVGLITSVSVFTSGMGGIRELAQGWMNVLVMVESIMGTLLFGLFIVAFSRKVIR